MSYNEMTYGRVGEGESSPPDPVSLKIDSAFSDFGRVMTNVAVPTETDRTIPQAYRDYENLVGTRHRLASTAEQVASAIEDIQSNPDPRITPEIRDAVVQQNLELWKIAKEQGEQELRTLMGHVRAHLGDVFASKVQVAESTDRALIRQEIQQALEANPKQTRTAVLAGLVQQDAARYGPEISSPYGKNLLALANEAEHHGAIVRRAQDLIPDTKRSANARAALKALDDTKIEGTIGAISWKANERVQAAVGVPRRGLVSEAGRTRGGRSY